MKAQDLRLGNYFKYGDKTFKVLGIGNNYVLANSNRGNVEFGIEDIEPIPLTEEWLLRFGFLEEKTIGNRKIFRLEEKHFRVEIAAFGYVVYYTIDKFLIYYGEHVHQLQNLYFALTGEELEIK